MIENKFYLIERNTKKYFKRYRSDYYDLFNEGCLGLLDAYYRFDPEKGDFDSFASQVIKNRLMDYIRKTKRDEEKTSSIYEKFDEEDDPLIEKLEDKNIQLVDDEIIEREEKGKKNKIAHDILSKLKPNERYIYKKKLETTYRKLSSKLKISPERIRQINIRAKRKIICIMSKDLREKLEGKVILNLVVFANLEIGDFAE